MNRKRAVLLLALLFLVACRQAIPSMQSSYTLPTLTPLPTDTARPTHTPIPDGAEGIGLAFFRAWEGRDYLGMYSLLSPQSQALVDSRSFVTLYERTMATATVQSLHARPLSSRQEGERAEFGARVTWKTATVGDITRDYTVELAYNQGRWGIVWHEGLILPELKGGERLHLEYRIPARANVYDINGKALAYQGTAITLGVIPGRIVDEPGLLAALSPLLNKPPDEIKTLYASALPDWYVPLGDIPAELMQANLAQLQPYVGAGLTANDRLARIYPDGGVAPHIVGYTGFMPAERLAEYQAKGYRGDERVGLAGVEAWGESYLSGVRGGVLTRVGPSGEYLSTIQESEPRQARSVYTTIERDFQLGVQEALAEAITTYPEGAAGAIVVLDVTSGAILAMASYPTYDPVIFDSVRPNAAAELGAVLSNPGRPLLNRAAQSAYPPGSIFKIITMAAGLNSGLYTPDTRYTSTGSWSRLGEAFIKYDWLAGGHGNVSLRQALVVSCNSCFFDVGYNVNNADPFLLANTSRQFGLGRPTGVQGIQEDRGLIPDPDWKLASYGEGWAAGDAVNMAIGQGFVLVTPLQITNVTAAIANGGVLYRPSVIDRIGAGGGAPEEKWPVETLGQLPLSPENLAVMQESLRGVANSPSGTAAFQFERLSVPVAGKTGTAETRGRSHALFTGYAPAAPYTHPDGSVIDTPQIAITIIIENAGEGSAVAAPVFRRIVELYYNLVPVTPYPWQ